MSEKIGIGYVGLGDHCSQSHLSFLNELTTSVETIGVADLAPVDTTAVNFVDDPIITRDYRELLADNRVDAIVITTGDASHFNIAEDAVRAGKHVLVEKPAAATAQELAALPGLFDHAEANQQKLWVCHPREFGNGPWRTTAQFLANPERISKVFDTGPMGELQEVRYDCQYTVPGKHGIHTSFADDKLNHTVVSALRSLPDVHGFRNATLLDNGATHFDARLVTQSHNAEQNDIVIRASGRRSAHTEHHGGGVYRDWVEAIFEEGVLRVEPTLGHIALTYGKKDLAPMRFDTHSLYDDMFNAFNREFVQSILYPTKPEPLSRQAKLLGTAAAILMQQPGFRGEVSEEAIRSMS